MDSDLRFGVNFRPGGGQVFPRSSGWAPGAGGAPTVPAGWGEGGGGFGELMAGADAPEKLADRLPGAVQPFAYPDADARLEQNFQRGPATSNGKGGGTVPVPNARSLPTNDVRLMQNFRDPLGGLEPVEVRITPANYGLTSPARRTFFMSQVGVTEPSMVSGDGRHYSPPWNVFKPYPNRQHATQLVLPGGVVMLTGPAILNPTEPPAL